MKVEINEPDTLVVRPEHIIDVISQESRIPRDMIYRDTNDRFFTMEEELGARRDAAGLQSRFSPLRGNTPFNNYLIVARRAP